MKLLHTSTLGLSSVECVSRRAVSEILSSLVEGQSISYTATNKIANLMGFVGDIPMKQISHFYLAIALRQLYGIQTYKVVIERFELNADVPGSSPHLMGHWVDIKKAGGFTREEFWERVTTLRIRQKELTL